jgi:hypothetical protein
MGRFWALLGVLAVVLPASPATAAEAARIVEGGRPRAAVLLPADCDPQTRAAAGLLVQYVKESSGAELPVGQEPAPAAAQPVTIHVGCDAYVKGLKLGLEKLDADGFVIRAVDGQHVVIAGPTPWGTELGVCEFLERCAGVRWLMPGPDGDDVPKRETIEIPPGEVRQEPVFISRLFSGLGGPQSVWARRNRMHGRIEFHHNLQQLFAPETYAKTHPEFYPLRHGKRYIPPDSATHGWQPCFSAEGSVEEAAAAISRYFDQHPEAPSYSLGVVDSSGHCECPKCQARDTGQKNFLGYRDCSDRYYGWCNDVVERVLKKHPGKFFGCLAYSEVGQAPSRVKVHPQIVPYMTYDRMKWTDPELRAEGRRMTEAWRAMSPVLGWYDYIYGSMYCVPRVWFHQMAEDYRFAQSHGVRAMYAEAYPNWGEGPKLYVSLKLQWNPGLDVDAVLREWYDRAVGPDAAGDLAAYYALWEDFWTRRILQSKWYTKPGQYLAFYDPGYLADVTGEDVARSRALLEAVVAKAKTPRQKARAGLLMLAFEYYEASAVAHAAGRSARQAAVRDEAEALQRLDEARRCLDMAAKRQRLVAEVFPKHPELMHPIDFDRYPKLRGDGWATGTIWTVFDAAAKSPKVRDRLREMAGAAGPAGLPAKTMLVLLDADSQPVSKNPSLESPDGRWPAEWSRWITAGAGTIEASPAAAHAGKQGAVCRGVQRGGPHQSLAIAPGRYAAVALLRVPHEPKGNTTITLAMTPLDEQGHNLPGIETAVRPKAGDWTRIAAAGQIPAEIGKKRVKSVRLIVVLDGFQPNEEVDLDEMAMYRLGD